jgi:hypothetical protein
MILKRVVYFIQSGEGCRKKAMEYALVLEALGVEYEILPLSLGYQIEIYRIQIDLSVTPPFHDALWLDVFIPRVVGVVT